MSQSIVTNALREMSSWENQEGSPQDLKFIAEAYALVGEEALYKALASLDDLGGEGIAWKDDTFYVQVDGYLRPVRDEDLLADTIKIRVRNALARGLASDFWSRIKNT